MKIMTCIVTRNTFRFLGDKLSHFSSNGPVQWFSLSRRILNVSSKKYVSIVPHDSKQILGVDKLTEEFRSAKSVKEVLSLSTQNENINPNHIVCALWMILQNGRNMNLEELLEDSNFESLCSTAISQAKNFTVRQSMFLLKSLAALPIPSTSRVVQAHLQILRKNFNFVEFSDISNLNALLKLLEKKQSSPLIEALKESIPHLMDIKLNFSSQYDELPIKAKIYLLSAAAEHSNVSVSNFQKMVLGIKRKKHDITSGPDLSILLIALIKIKDLPTANGLLKYLIDQYVSLISDFDVPVIFAILRVCRDKGFFNENLFDAVSNIVIEREMTWQNYQQIIALFLKLNYFSIFVLKSFCQELIKNELEVVRDKNLRTSHLMEYFVFSSAVMPEEFENAINIMRSNVVALSHLKDSAPHLLISLLCNFMCLNFYHKNLIEDIYSTSYLNTLLKDKRLLPGKENIVLKNFLLASHLLADRASTKHYVLPLSEIVSCMSRYMNNLKRFGKKYLHIYSELIKCVGSDDCVLSDVWTKTGIHIDYLVGIRNGKDFIKLDSLKLKKEAKSRPEVRFVEDFVIPLDIRLIAITVVQKNETMKNTPQLHSKITMKMDALKKIGCGSALINLEEWNSIEEIEKKPYVAEQIFNVVF